MWTGLYERPTSHIKSGLRRQRGAARPRPIHRKRPSKSLRRNSLRALSYRTNYSHGGTYYTLDSIAHFDELSSS